MEMLKASDISVAVGNKLILDGIGFSLYKNELLIIGGPNGAGKSTLIKAITNTIKFSGSCALLIVVAFSFTVMSMWRSTETALSVISSAVSFTLVCPVVVAGVVGGGAA